MRVLALGLWLAAPATAQPFADEPLRVEDDSLVVARSSAPDERIGPLAARRLSSRNRADGLGRDAMHRWVDDALDAAMAQPDVAASAHRVVDSDEVRVRTRPLVDASAVVALRLPLDALRAVAPLAEGPW